MEARVPSRVRSSKQYEQASRRRPTAVRTQKDPDEPLLLLSMLLRRSLSTLRSRMQLSIPAQSGASRAATLLFAPEGIYGQYVADLAVSAGEKVRSSPARQPPSSSRFLLNAAQPNLCRRNRRHLPPRHRRRSLRGWRTDDRAWTVGGGEGRGEELVGQGWRGRSRDKGALNAFCRTGRRTGS